MSVETLGVIVDYVGDGVTSAFPFPNYQLQAANFIVSVTPNGGGTSLLSYLANPGYLWSGIQDEWGAYPNGGTVQIVDQNGNPAPPPAGATIVIIRQTPKIQPMTYIDDDPFPATDLEHGLDRLTCIVQELAAQLGNFLGELPGPPTTGNLCDWFIVCPPTPGGPFGYICVQASTPSTAAVWCIISDVSL